MDNHNQKELSRMIDSWSKENKLRRLLRRARGFYLSVIGAWNREEILKEKREQEQTRRMLFILSGF
jgi:hypothetical protein